jgi:NadR type nicotinamide-nucleotide adenylyltransferase
MAAVDASRRGTVSDLLRVVVTGSESTGKTTLARDLARHFATAWSRENARLYVDEVRRPLGAEDVEPIARGQVELEDAARRAARRVVIHDTDLLSTMVYARHYYGECPEWIERAARERRGDLYLLCHPDVPWVADWLQRDRPGQRAELHNRFLAALHEIGARCVDIRGSWPARSSRATAAVQAELDRQPPAPLGTNRS